MNTMEWCFEVEDLVVSEDYEQPEMMSSPESWSPWGMTGFGGPCLPKKSFNFNSNMTREELTFNGGKNFYTLVDMAADSNNERSKSNNSSMSQELYNLLWNDQTDFQQFTEEEARINHMDEIFFSSLFEEDPTEDSTMPHETTILGNNTNIFEGEMVDSQDVGSHYQSIGCSKHLKTNAFTPSTDWVNGEALTTYQYSSNQNSTEESVLKDLERATTQLTDKTRIFLRDAFCRLAESSKHSVNFSQDGEHVMTCNDDTLRYRETEASDSKTTSIDRFVGSLMLSKFDFEEVDDQQVVSCCQNQKDYNDDAEVPVLAMEDRL